MAFDAAGDDEVLDGVMRLGWPPVPAKRTWRSSRLDKSANTKRNLSWSSA